jgi:hypothetical protein
MQEPTAAERILGMLSLARIRHAIPSVNANQMLEQINIVHREFRNLIPEIPSRDLYMRFLYSDLVSRKNDLWFELGTDQWTIELTKEAAERNIALIKARHGELFLKQLEAAARTFAGLFRVRTTPPEVA